MQPPEAGAAFSMPSSARSEAGIGKVEELGQDADESAVELAAAIRRRLAQLPDRDSHDEGIAGRRDRGAALVAAEREVGHLAETFARAEHRQEFLVLGHAHLALDDDAEEIAMVAFAHQRASGGHALPGTELDHLPELGIGKEGEKAHAAQRDE